MCPRRTPLHPGGWPGDPGGAVAPNERAARVSRGSRSEQDLGIVARAVQDVKDVDPLGGLTDDPIENLVVAVPPGPPAAVFVRRRARKNERQGGGGKKTSFEYFEKRP